jgi:dienelactone hydrolase
MITSLQRQALPLTEELKEFIGLEYSSQRISHDNFTQYVRQNSETIKGSYILYEIEYQSYGQWVPAFILMPIHISLKAREGQKKIPAVVVSHTHGSNWEFGGNEMVGQVGNEQEALAVDLVKRGYIVIAPDMMGFGKRIQISPQEQAEGMHGAVGYSNLLACLNVTGDNYLRHVIQDTMRAIDVLEAFPGINRTRIALLGYSFGGHISSKTAIFDERVHATVAFGSIGTIAEKIKTKCKIDPTENVAGLIKLGDTQDFLKLIAPRSFLISSSVDDKYALDSQVVYEAMKPRWEELKASENLTIYNHYTAGHRLTPEMKEEAYAWLDAKMFS